MAASQCASAEVQEPDHPLGRRQIEKILRHAGSDGDRPPEQGQRLLMDVRAGRRWRPAHRALPGCCPRCSKRPSATASARPASPETKRLLASRMRAIGSSGASAAARLAQTTAASGRPRCNAVSVSTAQAPPLSGAAARICVQILSAVARSPLASARRAPCSSRLRRLAAEQSVATDGSMTRKKAGHGTGLTHADVHLAKCACSSQPGSQQPAERPPQRMPSPRHRPRTRNCRTDRRSPDC